MAILYVGIDLAKNVLVLHGADSGGKPALLKPSVRRAELTQLIAKLPPRMIATKTCPGAHHWASDHSESAATCG